jgi:hypothetical protein
MEIEPESADYTAWCEDLARELETNKQNIFRKRHPYIARSLRENIFPNPRVLELYRTPTISQRSRQRGQRPPNPRRIAWFVRHTLEWQGAVGLDLFMRSFAAPFVVWEVLHPDTASPKSNNLADAPSTNPSRCTKRSIKDYFQHPPPASVRAPKPPFTFIEVRGVPTAEPLGRTTVSFDPGELFPDIASIFYSDLPRTFNARIPREYASVAKRRAYGAAEEGYVGLDVPVTESSVDQVIISSTNCPGMKPLSSSPSTADSARQASSVAVGEPLAPIRTTGIFDRAAETRRTFGVRVETTERERAGRERPLEMAKREKVGEDFEKFGEGSAAICRPDHIAEQCSPVDEMEDCQLQDCLPPPPLPPTHTVHAETARPPSPQRKRKLPTGHGPNKKQRKMSGRRPRTLEAFFAQTKGLVCRLP